MSIRIQIVTNSRDPVSLAIRVATRSWASHAEFVDTARDVTLGSRARSLRYPGGVQIRESKYDRYSRIEQFVLNSPDSQALLRRAWQWLEARVGTPYNYKGVLGIATDSMLENPRAMNCSQAVHLACWHGAGFPLLSTRPSAMPWRITPRDLLLSRGLVWVASS